MYYKFVENDIFINTIEVYPTVKFKVIYDPTVIVNRIVSRPEPAIMNGSPRRSFAFGYSDCGDPKLDFSCEENSYYVGVI